MITTIKATCRQCDQQGTLVVYHDEAGLEVTACMQCGWQQTEGKAALGFEVQLKVMGDWVPAFFSKDEETAQDLAGIFSMGAPAPWSVRILREGKLKWLVNFDLGTKVPVFVEADSD